MVRPCTQSIFCSLMTAFMLLAMTGCDDAQSTVLIRSVSPSSLPQTEGGTLIIKGQGFGDDTTVRIGKSAAGKIVRQSSTQITVTVKPTNINGPTTIEVSSNDAKATWSRFRFRGIASDVLRLIRVSDVPVNVESMVVSASNVIHLFGARGAQGFNITAQKLQPTFDVPIVDGPVGILASCAHDVDADGLDDVVIVSKMGRQGVWLGTVDGLMPPMVVPEPTDMGMDMMLGDMGTDMSVMGPEVVLSAAACQLEDRSLKLAIAAIVEGEHVVSVISPQDIGDSTAIARGVVLTLSDAIQSIESKDLNADGSSDLVVINGQGVSVWFGSNTDRYERAGIGQLPTLLGQVYHSVLVDYDDDGHQDLLWATSQGMVVWRFDGETFKDVTVEIGGGITQDIVQLLAQDFDRDGLADLLVRGKDGRVSLYVGDGQRFYDATRALLPLGALGGTVQLMSFDMDADEDLDLVALDTNHLSIYRNWSPDVVVDDDGDGLPNEIDVCPAVFDPAQKNQDALPFLCGGDVQCQQKLECTRLDAPDGTAYLRCNAKKTQRDAALFCAKQNAHLVRFKSIESQKWLMSQWTGRFWLDWRDNKEEGKFVDAADGPAPFLDWLENQPDNAGDGEDCIELISREENPGWNDIPCSAERAFVCQTMPVDMPDPGDACDVCPLVHDPQQADADDDGVGDACQSEEEGS